MMAHRHFLPGRRAAVLALGGFSLARAVLPVQASDRTPSSTPNPLYTHSFARLDQDALALQSFLGAPLLINFWASWCPPCVKEMPDLDGLAQAHPRVGFVGLAVDSEVNVRRFLAKTPVSYPILLTGHGGIALMRELGNRQGGLPFTLVFDARGQLHKQLLGPIQVEHVDDWLRALAA